MFVFSWRSWLLFPEIQLVISIWPKTSFGYKNQCHRNKEGLTVWPCLYCHLHQAPQTHTKNERHNFQSRNTLLEIRWKLQTPTKPKKSFKTFCAWSGNSLEELKSGNLKVLRFGISSVHDVFAVIFTEYTVHEIHWQVEDCAKQNTWGKILQSHFCPVPLISHCNTTTHVPQYEQQNNIK